jgi:hypothetical protein
MVVDPPPPDAGIGGSGGQGGAGGMGGAGVAGGQGEGGMVVDPPPPDAGMTSVEVESDARTAENAGPPRRKLRLIDQWFDTSPKAAVRTVDLPLFDPPRPKLTARRDGDRVRVTLDAGPARVSTRWEADGDVTGDGLEVSWRPSGPSDRIRVAIRSRGGVAVLSLRAEAAKIVT